MASLYIKDEETAAPAAEVEQCLWTTKTHAVRSALREKQVSFAVERPSPDMVAWVKDYHRRHPVPPNDKFTADKVFYDWLSGEEGVEDFFKP